MNQISNSAHSSDCNQAHNVSGRIRKLARFACALGAFTFALVPFASAMSNADIVTITTSTPTCSPTGLTDGSGTICYNNTSAFSLTALENGTQTLNAVVGTQKSPVYLVVNDTTSTSMTFTYSGVAQSTDYLACTQTGSYASDTCSVTGVQGSVLNAAHYGPPSGGWPNPLVAQFSFTGVPLNSQFDISFNVSSTSDVATLTGPCYGSCQVAASCAGSSTTTITGTVYVPNGVDPLPNALVYIPSAQPDPLTAGVQCLVAGTEGTGSPVAQTHTAVDGTFTLTGVPTGTNIPIVIESGKWRMQGTVQTVTGCVNNVAPAWATTFPNNHAQGDIPKIALVTGNVDALECVLRKTGLTDSEFTDPGGLGQVNFYRGSGAAGSKIDNSTPSESALVSSPSTLANYDMVMFPCQGGEYTQSSGDLANLLAYGNVGGRIFATHYSYVWLYNNPTSSTGFGAAANWQINQSDPTPDPGMATVDSSFANGTTLSQWLQNAGASTTLTQIDISTLRLDQTGVIAPTQSWLTLNTNNTNGEVAHPVMQMTFNTPVNAAANAQCGRVLYNEYHVENATSTGNATFPAECSSGAMTAQEKLLEYALFDLSTAITPVVAPTVSQTYTNTPTTFTQGDPGDTIQVDVTNTSPSNALDSSLTFTATLPPGVTATAMTDNSGGWNCTVGTLTCTRTTPLAAGADDPVTITCSVSPTAPTGSGGSLTSTVSGGYMSNNVVGTDPLTIVAGSQPQAIIFNPPTPVTYGVSPITLSATGGASGNPVTYSIVSGPGTLSGPNNSILTVNGTGPIVIAANQAGGSGYTAAPQVTGVVNVQPAVLTVTANNATRAYESPNPPFSAVITGFVHGDTIAVVGGSASISTGADINSPVGNYPIVPLAGTLTAANYTFQYVNGNLAITPAPQAITFAPSSPVQLGTPPITLTATGGGSGNPVTYTLISGPGTLSGPNNSILTVTGGGAIVIAANQAGNTNYTDAPTVTATILVTGTNCDYAPTEAVGTTSPIQTAVLTINHDFTLSSISVGALGEPGKDYTLAAGGTCTISTHYTAGQICTVNYTFTPTTPGALQGNVTLMDASGDVDSNIGIKGTGTGPQIVFDGIQSTAAGDEYWPEGVAVDGHGNLYNTTVGLSEVHKQDWDGTNYTQNVIINSGLNGPYGIAADCRGNLYIADEDDDQVVKETWNGHGYDPSTVGSGLADPNGVAVDCSGNVYVADSGHSRVLKETVHDDGSYSQDTVADAPGNNVSGPQGVAVDGDGNVYIADTFRQRILKESPNGSGGYNETTVCGGLGNPLGVAVDQKGNVYVSDTNNKRILREMPNGSGGYSQSVVPTSGLSMPYGLAVDDHGSLYIADAPNDRIVKVDVSTPPTLNFAATSVGSPSPDSPQTATATNIGNATLTFPIPGSGNNPAISANFTLNSSGSGACPLISSGAASPGTLAADASCTLAVSFDPTVSGNQSGTLNLTDDSLNAHFATQSIALNGLGSQGVQSINFSPIISPVVYGDWPISLIATATSGLPVSFHVVSGPAFVTATTLTITGGGTVVVAADQAGNSSYGAAPEVTQTIVVTAASSWISKLVSNSNPVLLQNSVTFTATVNGTYAVPTGVVTFFDGASSLGSAAVDGAGNASFTTSLLSVGSHSITAVYDGSASYTSSGSGVLNQVVDDFSLTVPGGTSSTPTVTAQPGGVAIFTFTLSPIGSPTFLAPITLTASGLPPGATTVFSPSTISAGAGPTVVTLTVTLPQIGWLSMPFAGHSSSGSMLARFTAPVAAPFALALLLLPFAGRMRRSRTRLRIILPLLLLLAALGTAIGISGCGSGTVAGAQSYNVIVNANSGALTHSTAFTLKIQ